jgi:hypothetical protein
MIITAISAALAFIVKIVGILSDGVEIMKRLIPRSKKNHVRHGGHRPRKGG